jgi:hypothetical protein
MLEKKTAKNYKPSKDKTGTTIEKRTSL